MPSFQMPDGAELFYRISGESAAGTALFVHPFTHDGTIWMDQLRDLRAHRRCIAIDLRGHGKSDPNPNPMLVDTEHVADLAAVIDMIEGPIDLVGVAFGGVLCALAYEARPKRIRSLTLMSSAFDGGEPDPATKRYAAEMGRIAVLEDKGILYRRMLEYVVSPEASLFTKARYRSILERTPTETLVGYYVNKQFVPRPDLPAKLDLPVFMPMGADDSVVDLSGPLGDIPNLVTKQLPAAGRLLPIEAPAELNAAIAEFWASLA